MPTNVALVRKYVCAQCFGVLVEKYVDGAFKVVCPKECQPGGFVTRTWAERRKVETAAELEEVARLYPSLGARKKMSSQESQAMRVALYGGEE